MNDTKERFAVEYCLSQKYEHFFKDYIMGPNPIKLEEELLRDNEIPAGSVVMDLGSGTGLTSLFLAKEYDLRVYAADLWSDPGENLRFFEKEGVSRDRLVPIRADATDLPFADNFFDAVVSIDSYNYFGRDAEYLDKCLLPKVRRGGLIYIAIPGMVKDCHDALPPELLLSWTPEQLEYMHDAAWWRAMVGRAKSAEVLEVSETEGNAELWADWLRCENEYAVHDRLSMDAGAGRYLNFIKIVLRKRD